jgi:hypothetical protein
MARHRIVLGKTNRAIAKRGVDAAPNGYVLELRDPKRSDLQNAALHGLVGQILKQRPIHRGNKMTMESYKAAFMHLLGSEMQFIPALDGDGFYPMGKSTSDLTKSEFSNLIECILAWCAREGITVKHFDEESSTRAGASVKGASEVVA